MEDSEPTDQEKAAPQTGAANSYAVLRNRDFLVYLIGRFIASLGQQMFTMAIA